MAATDRVQQWRESREKSAKVFHLVSLEVLTHPRTHPAWALSS